MTRYADLFQSAESPTATAPAGGEPGVEGAERFTLLFVDDEESVLHALRRIFLEENYEIRIARAAEDAIRILEEEKVHLVVTDHRMPGMTGAQFLREVKKRWPETIRSCSRLATSSDPRAVKEGRSTSSHKPWNRGPSPLGSRACSIRPPEGNRRLGRREAQQSKIKNYAPSSTKRAVAGNS